MHTFEHDTVIPVVVEVQVAKVVGITAVYSVSSGKTVKMLPTCAV